MYIKSEYLQPWETNRMHFCELNMKLHETKAPLKEENAGDLRGGGASVMSAPLVEGRDAGEQEDDAVDDEDVEPVRSVRGVVRTERSLRRNLARRFWNQTCVTRAQPRPSKKSVPEISLLSSAIRRARAECAAVAVSSTPISAPEVLMTADDLTGRRRSAPSGPRPVAL